MRLLSALIVVLAACSSDGPDGPEDSEGAEETGGTEDTEHHHDTDECDPGIGCDTGSWPNWETSSLPAHTDAILNPDRGFIDYIDIIEDDDFTGVRDAGMTLAYAGVHLDDYRDKPLDDAFLEALEAGFGHVRDAHIKVVLRFVYNDGFDDDASKEQILEHLDQLAPLLADNADVIAVVQAGFIGAWGEWHSSTNGLDNDADRTEILGAIVVATPLSRMVQVRTPMFKEAAVPVPGPMTSGFNGSNAARIGHHNDCFLASDSDEGTYDDPIADWKAYVATESQFTPWGGETCAWNPPRTDCATALDELEELHASYLNALYHPDVIDGWDDGGCLAEIDQRLGYRWWVSEVAHNRAVRPGGVLFLYLRVVNNGWAVNFNERPVEVVLGDLVAKVSVDTRTWVHDVPQHVQVALRVPSSLPEGSYPLSLRFPDPLSDAPDSYIQLANQTPWDGVDNRLVEGLVVDVKAAGHVVEAEVFEEVPWPSWLDHP